MTKSAYILLIFLFIGQASFAQKSDPLHLFDSTQKENTFDTVYNDIKSTLSAMAGELKTTADHVYAVLVRQQLVNSCINVLCLMLAIPLFLYFLKGMKKRKEGQEWPDTPYTFAIIIACILFGAFLLTINSTITGFVNPEYGAMKEIMSYIK